MGDKNIIILFLALPITLSLHVFEEFAFPGGLMQWIKAYKPRKPKNGIHYFIVNAAAIVGAFILALAPRGIFDFRIYLYFVAVMAANAASHILGTIQKRQYCPGSVSSGLLLLPVFVISWWYYLDTGKLNLPSAVVGICFGGFLGFYVMGMDIRKSDYAA